MSFFIDVMDDDVMSSIVQEMHGQKVDARALRVGPIGAESNLTHYHILFVGGGDAEAVRTVLERVESAPVFPWRGDHFTGDGGAVRLFTDRDRLRFEMNIIQVERAGLKVSAKMLGLAKL